MWEKENPVLRREQRKTTITAVETLKPSGETKRLIRCKRKEKLITLSILFQKIPC